MKVTPQQSKTRGFLISTIAEAAVLDPEQMAITQELDPEGSLVMTIRTPLNLFSYSIHENGSINLLVTF